MALQKEPYRAPLFLLSPPADPLVPWRFEPPSLIEPTCQLCTYGQMESAEYRHWTSALCQPPNLHRKLWEWAYVMATLQRAGMLAKGRHALGFGVGREPIASLLAHYGLRVTATDAPFEMVRGGYWELNQQHARALEQMHVAEIVDAAAFRDRVALRPVDMNAIPDDLTGFDVCWSSCSLEHLGSLKHGLDFVEKAMRCLKAGGVAVHTTEFNLSSNEDTIEDAGTSIYRKRDIEELAGRLVREGHTVLPLNFHPGERELDAYVDGPPYQEPHLKLLIERFSCTSLGIAIRKSSGRSRASGNVRRRSMRRVRSSASAAPSSLRSTAPVRALTTVSSLWTRLGARANKSVPVGRAGPRLDRVEQRLERISAALSRLEQLAHGGQAVYVGPGRILVKATLGDVNLGYLVEADDLLFGPYLMVNGYHERDITNFYCRAVRNIDNCIDVGANFGYYTCLFGKLANRGRTIAIEPDEKMFNLLRDNIYINSLEAMTTPMHSAAADREATLTLHRRITRSGNTSMIEVPAEALKQMGEPPSPAFDIAAMPIDQLLPQFDGRVNHVKIDVEGAEPLVLRGAKQIIANNPVINIVMEWSPNQLRAAGFDPAQFTIELAEMGLSSAAIGKDRPEPIAWDALLGLAYHPGILLTLASR